MEAGEADLRHRSTAVPHDSPAGTADAAVQPLRRTL